MEDHQCTLGLEIKMTAIKRKPGLLPGSFAFLFLVVYINIRHNTEMNFIDWGVIILGFLMFTYALWHRFRRQG